MDVKRGGRGRGGFGRDRGRGRSSPIPTSANEPPIGPDVATPVPVKPVGPKPSVSAPLPKGDGNSKPKRLSVAPSALKNDPMMDDILSSSILTSFRPTRRVPSFRATMEGFVALATKTHGEICARDRMYRRNVSESMFSYYATQVLWSRILQIRSLQGRSSQEEDNYLLAIKQANYTIPLALQYYIKSFGSFKSRDNEEYELDTSILPSVIAAERGSFGRVSAETHFNYENLISPLVTVMRIQKDMAYTANPTLDREWNLPATLRPVDKTAGLPTANLLGWARSQQLTLDQIRVLETSGFDINEVDIRYRGFLYSSELMSQISGALTNAERVYKLTPAYEERTRWGSIGMSCFVTLDKETDTEFLRSRQYTLQSFVVPHSDAAYDDRIATGVAALVYRVRKDSWTSWRPWSCYDFSNYTQVPDSWDNNRNEYYSYGGIVFFNTSKLSAISVDRDQLITHIAERGRV